MKQKLLALVLCIGILMGIMPTAGAATAVSHSFLQIDHETISTFGAHGFHDGMLAITEKFTPYDDPHKYRYLREDGEVIVFDGAYGYDYSEGLVAVVNQDHKVGYADLNGNLVIPYQFDLYCASGELKTGTFFGGKCPVFIKTGDAGDVDYNVPTGTMYGTWKTIDRTGKIISDSYNPQHVFNRSDGYFTDEKGVLKTNNSGFTYYEPVEFEGKTHPYQEFSGDLGIFNAGMVIPNDQRMYIVRRNASGSTTLPPAGQKPQNPAATYGQSTVTAKGYVIENNVGYLIIDITNQGKAADEGDLFYVLYNKYDPESKRGETSTSYVPADYIRQIHYQVEPGKTKTIRMGVGQTIDIGRELTDEELDYGWMNNPDIVDSRFVLAQAESRSECAELVQFFKNFHYWEGFMTLSYQPDENGVTCLAAPGGTLEEANRLDEKLSAFTSKFK